MESLTDPKVKLVFDWLVPPDRIAEWFITPNENLDGATPLVIWNAGYREAVSKLMFRIEVGG